LSRALFFFNKELTERERISLLNAWMRWLGEIS